MRWYGDTIFSAFRGSTGNSSFFFFNDTATTEIYTLSLHDALPILTAPAVAARKTNTNATMGIFFQADRKSTRLNSSHTVISYAVFCLKNKKNITAQRPTTNKNNALAHEKSLRSVN